MPKGFKIREVENSTEYVYDIEIEDNNNFFANNVLVHNCFISVAPKIKI